MTEKKHFVSLSVKPLFVLLLGLVLGVCVCLLANFTGEQIIERSYMSDKAVLKRTNRAAQEFQSFVRQNSISTRDTDMLARWGESRKNYYIMLYHDQRQILEIGWARTARRSTRIRSRSRWPASSIPSCSATARFTL